jgi:hypothetical protein
MAKITSRPIFNRLQEGVDETLREIRKFKAAKEISDNSVINTIKSKPTLTDATRLVAEISTNLKSNPSALDAQTRDLNEARVKALLEED